jgi:origin recognition complex subunit 6
LTPKKRGRPPKSSYPDDSPSKVQKTPIKATPYASAASSPSLTPKKRGRPAKETPLLRKFQANRTIQPAKQSEKIQPWIRKSINHLCRTLSAPAAAMQILAGVTTILTKEAPFLPNDPTASVEAKRDKIPALIIAVYFFVHTRLVNKETDGQGYVYHRKAAMEALASEESEVEKETITSIDVDTWLKDIADRGWLREDWFNNIVQGSGLGNADDAPEDLFDESEPVGDANELDGRQGTVIDISAYRSQRGLGTMYQKKVDYLSDEKRKKYANWKEKILKTIDEGRIVNGGNLLESMIESRKKENGEIVKILEERRKAGFAGDLEDLNQIDISE